MNTIKLTQKDFKDGVYCGKRNLTDIQGNLEIEATGRLRFNSNISAKGYIRANGYIHANGYISAGDYISAEDGIHANGGIYAEGYIFTRGDIYAKGGIYAKGHISAEGDIYADGDIYARGYISAENGMLKAIYGITAGLNIFAKTKLSAGMRIFAGVAPYSWVNDSNKEIKCGKLEGGTIAYGTLIETGLEGKIVKIKVKDGQILEGTLLE